MTKNLKASRILIMAEGTYHKTRYTKSAIRKMKLPKQLPLTVCFDNERVAGKVKNIHCENSRIYGDFLYKPEYELFYVGPRLMGNLVIIKKNKFLRGIELDGITVVNFPFKPTCSDKLLNDKEFDRMMKEEEKRKCRKKKSMK